MATLMDLVVPPQKPKGTQMLRDLVRGYNREAVSGMLGAPVDMANTLANLLIAGGGFAAHKAGLIDQPPELIDNARAVGSSDWIYNRLPNQPQMTGSKSEYAGRLAGALMPPPAMMKVAPQTLASLLRTAQEKVPAVLNNYMGKTGMLSRMSDADDYRIQHRPMTEAGGAARIHDLTPAFGEDIYTSNALQYFGSGDKREANVLRLLNSIRGKPDEMVTIYRGVPDKAMSISSGDWVTLDPAVAADYGYVVSMKVPASHITGWGDSLLEFGYYPPATPK
jgi:hypothetical protein